MKFLQFFFVLVLNLLLIFALNNKIGSIPPLGKLLDPFSGFWQNAEPKKPILSQEIQISGLKGKASVVYDEQFVPHIFAENDADLYRLQGYITASLRLWQMEFQTHAAAGRVSEIVGELGIDFDKEQRRKGMVFGAEKAHQAMLADPISKEIIEAYSEGVNEYIKSLKPKDLPLEYKILDYQPEAWTSLKSALLLKYMSRTLAMGENDIEYTNALKLFGKPVFEVLYPDFQQGQDPVVNKSNQWKFEKNKVDTSEMLLPKEFIGNAPAEKVDKGIGSNNWAVSGKKTASGSPILCDDPHLELNLPSIWLAMQLNSPSINCYGVTLPGSPSIIVGFNDSISWGVTNAQRDVLDWYKVKFKDKSKKEYFLDDQWVKSDMKIEEIKVKNKPTVYDTVYYTTWGPVVYDDVFPMNKKTYSADLAMRWVAHDPSNELLAYYNINRAKNFKEFQIALKDYQCPAQNFAFASTSGDIAMHIQGKHPLRWQNQGKFISDGTKSSQKWQGFIPNDQVVFHLNPERNYVSSANQNPVDPTYPYQVFADSYEHYRNRRINHRLDSLEKITPRDMMKLHNDNFNLQAYESLPFFLSKLKVKELDKKQQEFYEVLASWNYLNDADLLAPAYYETWWFILSRKVLWDEFDNDSIYLARPENFNSIRILKEMPNFELIDIKATPKKETVEDLLQLSFKMAADSLENWKKANQDLPAQWANYKNT
ncbi:MAG: penicillin acylase family protein, partial [Bacteroidetes bacterium]